MPGRVVMIDDSEDILFLLQTYLHKRGVAVIGVAGTLGTGLELVASTNPDAVLVDVRLPDADGLATTTARLRASSPTAKIIALSSAPPSAGWGDAAIAEAGCDAYFDKAIGMARLTDEISHLLNGSGD